MICCRRNANPMNSLDIIMFLCAVVLILRLTIDGANFFAAATSCRKEICTRTIPLSAQTALMGMPSAGPLSSLHRGVGTDGGGCHHLKKTVIIASDYSSRLR